MSTPARSFFFCLLKQTSITPPGFCANPLTLTHQERSIENKLKSWKLRLLYERKICSVHHLTMPLKKLDLFWSNPNLLHFFQIWCQILSHLPLNILKIYLHTKLNHINKLNEIIIGKVSTKLENYFSLCVHKNFLHVYQGTFNFSFFHFFYCIFLPFTIYSYYSIQWTKNSITRCKEYSHLCALYCY